MMTQEEKNEFLQEFDRFMKSDFTSFDLACFIKYDKIAQYLLSEFACYNYKDELENLSMFDESTIKSILNTPHMEYYDPLYGSSDPLISFRISKADMADCNMKDLHEYDNILSHLIDQLDKEPTKIDLKDVLNRENLEKLKYGEIDVPASQIYYFERKGDQGGFYFEHYFCNGGWDRNAFPEYDINDFDQRIEIDRYDDWREAFDAYVETFANMYMNHCSGIPDTLDNEVFNGVEAVARLRATFEPVFEEVWKRKRQELNEKGGKEAEEERNRLYYMLANHPQVLTLPYFRDKKSFDFAFGSADAATLRLIFDIVKDLALEIEKRDRYIEQYQKEVETLNKYLRLERAKQKAEEINKYLKEGKDSR